MTIFVSTENYSPGSPSEFQTLLVSHDPTGFAVELDGPDAWELYQRLESFIKDPKTKFPEAILAFEFDEGFAGEDPMPVYAWTPHLLSPCCGSEVEGVYAEQQSIFLNIEEVHDGTVWLDSSDGDGGTLLWVCANPQCSLGVSLPEYLDPNWA